MKKKKQAPKGKWRYGIVKRTYITTIGKKTFRETIYELAEVRDKGRSWSAEAVSLSANTPFGLYNVAERVLDDIATYPVIVEKKPIRRSFPLAPKVPQLEVNGREAMDVVIDLIKISKEFAKLPASRKAANKHGLEIIAAVSAILFLKPEVSMVDKKTGRVTAYRTRRK